MWVAVCDCGVPHVSQSVVRHSKQGIFKNKANNVSAMCPLQYNTVENKIDRFIAHDPPAMKLPISGYSLARNVRTDGIAF